MSAEPCDLGGRRSVGVVDIADGQAIVRRSARGGLVGVFVKDGYLFRNRPRAEFEVHRHLYESGVAVPEPLGVAWERRGVVFGGALATRRIEGDTLRTALDENRVDDALSKKVGETIRAVHDAGVYHADLNVENILVGDSGVMVIDFDKSEKQPSVSQLDRARNLLRLRRSFAKRGLSLDAYETIRAGYGPLPIPSWLDVLYRLKGRASDLLALS
jgi:3-deoxy-D-manno-octulosonic acid kinase